MSSKNRSSETLSSEKFSTEIENLPTTGELILGRVHSIDALGRVVVSFSITDKTCVYFAQATVSITAKDVGRQVALMFVNGQPDKPLVIGFIYSPLDEIINNYAPYDEKNHVDKLVFDDNPTQQAPIKKTSQTIKVDGKRVVIEGDEEVVLQCGEASITLTKAGKVMIRGKYILNRSSGVNRILGGSVQVN